MSVWRSYTVSLEDSGKRLDAVLGRQQLFVSRSAAAHAIDNGSVLVNGKQVGKNYRVCSGQVIVYELPDTDTLTPLQGEDIPLDIRFEDEHLIVLSKQPGLVCHPYDGCNKGTLVNALIHHCGEHSLCNVQGDRDRLGIVHRLDGDTSGLMLAAKTDEAGRILMEDIRARSVDRRYLALVHGVMAMDTGMIDAPIARHAKERTRMAVRECPSSREALTTFVVKQRFAEHAHDKGYTLIECKLFTGRTHQIRVHMEYTGHPVVGDPIYCSHAPKVHEASLGLNRQFLHSCHLAFTHPITQAPLEFEDNLPSDLNHALECVQDRSLIDG